MNLRIPLVAASLLFTTLPAHAQSDGEQPLLVRLADAGFTPLGGHTATQCALYKNRVVVTRWLEDVQSVEERAITIDGDITQHIDAAAAGDMSESILPVDMPTLHYIARRVLKTGEVEFVDLGSNLSGVRIENNSGAARGLKLFLDTHCPTVAY